MKTTLLYICARAVLSAVLADDIKLADGKTVYHNAEIISSDAASVTIKHSTGIARVLIKELPEDIRAKLRFDANKASAIELEQAKATAAYNAKIQAEDDLKKFVSANAVWISGKIIQVMDRSVLMRLSSDENVWIDHIKTAGLIDGNHLDALVIPAGTHQYTSVIGGTNTVRAYEVVKVP